MAQATMFASQSMKNTCPDGVCGPKAANGIVSTTQEGSEAPTAGCVAKTYE